MDFWLSVHGQNVLLFFMFCENNPFMVFKAFACLEKGG